MCNFFHITIFAKCNDCGHIGDNLRFYGEAEIAIGPQTATYSYKLKCPVCNSENVEDLYYNTEPKIQYAAVE